MVQGEAQSPLPSTAECWLQASLLQLDLVLALTTTFTSPQTRIPTEGQLRTLPEAGLGFSRGPGRSRGQVRD